MGADSPVLRGLGRLHCGKVRVFPYLKLLFCHIERADILKVFFLILFNKLRGLYMPSNNNLHVDDVEKLLLFGRFIEKWSDDTMNLFESEVKSEKLVDHLCITSLTVSKTYVKAIIILLSNGLRMPVKALLRIIFELAVKLAWCLGYPDDYPDPDKLVEEKIRRWSKSSLIEDLKIIKDSENFYPQGAIHKLKTRRDNIEKLLKNLDDVNELPQLNQLVKQLSGDMFSEFYTRCYREFNNAVHLDISSLGNRVKDDGTKLFVGFDSEEPVEDLIRHCVLMERIIFFLVRSNYNWDTKQLMEDKI